MTSSKEQRIAAYPDTWSQHISSLIGSTELNVAGYTTSIEITEAQLKQVYFPLLARLDDLYDHQGSRVLAGLVGIPGSGKSTFAAALAHIASSVFSGDSLIVVGMDGWHLPNAILDQRTTQDAAGNIIPLRERKGSPESFDADAMANALQELQQTHHPIKLPVYDRQLHEPIPDALTIKPHTRIVLVEGNYLLCNNPPWDKISNLLHPKLFLECNPDIARERIISRHIRGGLNKQEAIAKYADNDSRNTDTVLASQANTGLHLNLSPENMTWNSSR